MASPTALVVRTCAALLSLASVGDAQGVAVAAARAVVEPEEELQEVEVEEVSVREG